MKGARPSLLALCMAVSTCGIAQERAPTLKSDTAEGLRILAQVDKRMYYASQHGLSALSFTFRPRINDRTGKPLGLAPFRVRYRWRARVGERVDYMNEEGQVRAFAELPGESALKKEGFERRRALNRLAHLRTCRNFLPWFLGRRLQDRFNRHRLTVSRRMVNEREEIVLIIEPRTPVRLKRLKITLDRHGLPWKEERILTNGHILTQQNDYSKRPEGHLLESYKIFDTPPSADQKGFNYAIALKFQRVDGFILPASVRKAGKDLPASEKGSTEFGDVLVNGKVAPFQPMTQEELKPPK